MDAVTADLNRLLIQIDHEIPGLDDRLGVTLGTADNGVDAGNQLVLVERLGEIIISTKAQTFTLSSMPAMPDRIRIGVFTFATRSDRSTS